MPAPTSSTRPSAAASSFRRPVDDERLLLDRPADQVVERRAPAGRAGPRSRVSLESPRDRRAARLPRLHRQADRAASGCTRPRGSRSSSATSAGSSAPSRPTSARSPRTRASGRYDSYAERERRRAELQADERWKAFLARIQPLIHTQQNRILIPTSLLAAASEARGQGRASSPAARRGSATAIADGLAADGAEVVIADLNPPEGGIRADVADEDGRPADGRRDRRAPRPARHPDQQRRPLRLARDAAVHRDPARRVAAGDGRERRLDVPHLPGGRAGDARAGRRQDREHLVGDAVPRRAVPAPLRDEQGRDRRAHPRAREGARQGRDPRQLRRARASR